jgi:hypothetical protein
MTVAPAARAASAVSSLEQSSTTITSAGGRGRWSSALRTARFTMSGRLYAGITTVTGSGSDTVSNAIPRPGARGGRADDRRRATIM